MICLDTNYLILGLSPSTLESANLVAWSRSGEILVTAAPAWYEFLCGPVDRAQIAVMAAFLSQIIPFSDPQARAAASLFNAAGRRRSLRVDAMIAGTAIAEEAALATNNQADFTHFVPHGLQLA
ncbi:hypothetical protein BH23VER1_BH23VER1_33020 [soil metagenome]